jgi:Dienelactone hydrolase family
VGSYGGKDRSPMGRSAAPRLERALTALSVDHDVKVYPGAGHGFLNDPEDATPLLIFLAKISGTRYHEPSAQDAPTHRRVLRRAPEELTEMPPRRSDCVAAVAITASRWSRRGRAPGIHGDGRLPAGAVHTIRAAGR